jgi:hypothetical protein
MFLLFSDMIELREAAAGGDARRHARVGDARLLLKRMRCVSVLEVTVAPRGAPPVSQPDARSLWRRCGLSLPTNRVWGEGEHHRPRSRLDDLRWQYFSRDVLLGEADLGTERGTDR